MFWYSIYSGLVLLRGPRSKVVARNVSTTVDKFHSAKCSDSQRGCVCVPRTLRKNVPETCVKWSGRILQFLFHGKYPTRRTCIRILSEISSTLLEYFILTKCVEVCLLRFYFTVFLPRCLKKKPADYQM